MHYANTRFPKRKWLKGPRGWCSVPATKDDHARRYEVLQALSTAARGGAR